MKRRSFIASLIGLPFVAKPLEAMAQADRKAHMREYMRTTLIDELNEHYKRVLENSESMKRNAGALLHNMPAGWKKRHFGS